MRNKDIKFNWLSVLRRKNPKNALVKILPTGVTVERKRFNGVERINVICPEASEPVNMAAVRNMHVIDPVYVHPTKPSFFISEEPVNKRGSWKKN